MLNFLVLKYVTSYLAQIGPIPSQESFFLLIISSSTWNAEQGKNEVERKSTTCGKEETQLNLGKRPSALSKLYAS